MNNLKLESFLNGLCADDVNKVLSVLGLNGENFITAKDSNHKIINRERKIVSCPHCGSMHTVKNGKTKAKRQKYMCIDCKKSFSNTTNTIAYRSKKSYETWIKYIECLIKGFTLKDSADEVNLSTTSSFVWRHKILKTLNKFNKAAKLSGTIQADALYLPINLKGTKPNKMPRYSKVRTSSRYRGLSHHKICVMSATDDSDNMIFEISGLGPETTNMLMDIKDRFQEGTTLITDSKRSFDGFVKQMGMKHDYIPSGFYKSDSGNTLATLNGLHSELKTWLKKYRGVSARHLQGYLDLFRYLKHLRYTTEYRDRSTKTYCYAIPSYTKCFTDEIYTKEIPIDLKTAYGEYHYGIFA
jgi:transposase-like protein